MSNYLKLLVQLCDLVAPLVLFLCKSMSKANLSDYLKEIQNVFILFNSSSVRGVMIENISDFNLICNLLHLDVTPFQT